MKAIIVDDENLARRSLRQLIQEFCPEIVLLGEAASVAEALKLIKENPPELIFLDIEMPTISGLQLPSLLQAELPKLKLHIIFTTAYSKYAVEAFRLAAIDYLLKPININQLQEAIQKAKDQQDQNLEALPVLQENLASSYIKRLVIPTSKGLEFLAVDQIRMLVAEGSYTNIYLYDGRRLVVSKNLKEFQKLEAHSHFFKCHRSYLINVNAIRQFSQVDGQYITLDNGEKVPLSKRRKALFLDLIKKRDFGFI